MGTRGGETRDTENTGLTVLPPPERCVPHRTPSNGEGGMGALEALRDTETGQDRRPPGRRLFRDPRRSRELGRPWRDRLRDHGPSPHLGLFSRSPTTPPKNFLGENRGSIGHLGAYWRRGLLGSLGRRGLLGALGRRGH